MLAMADTILRRLVTQFLGELNDDDLMALADAVKAEQERRWRQTRRRPERINGAP